MANTDRSFSWLRAARRRLLWIPLIPLTSAVIFLLVANSLLGTAARLDRDGMDTQATVLDRRIVQVRDSDGNSSTEYRVRVEFRTISGETVEASFDVRRSTYDSTQQGRTLPVRYLPDDPTVSELERGTMRTGGRIFTFVSFMLLMTALGVGLWLGRDLPAVARAYRHGIWREARVEAHQDTRIKVNQTYLKRLSWQDETGAVGQSMAHRPDRLPAPGERIVVLVDPETGQSWWDRDA
jgi:hypothetical protein